MESCIVVCRKKKLFERKNKILFINGLDEIVCQNALSFLANDNIQSLFKLYCEFKDVPGKARVVSIQEIREKRYSLNIPYYVQKWESGEIKETYESIKKKWAESSISLKSSFSDLKIHVMEVLE